MSINPFDRILDKEKATVADLNEEELLMYQQASEAINKKPPTINDQVEMLNELIENLIVQLCDVHTSGKNCFLDANLKARLKNAMVIKRYLTAPERAKKYYEKLAQAHGA